LNVKCKTIELLEKEVKENLQDPGKSKGFSTLREITLD
jgi:hypothetical protein